MFWCPLKFCASLAHPSPCLKSQPRGGFVEDGAGGGWAMQTDFCGQSKQFLRRKSTRGGGTHSKGKQKLFPAYLFSRVLGASFSLLSLNKEVHGVASRRASVPRRPQLRPFPLCFLTETPRAVPQPFEEKPSSLECLLSPASLGF